MSTTNPKPTAESRKDGRDGRKGIYGDPGTFTTSSRSGVTFPNEDVTATITREQFEREGRG
jgi:hypothetical protein